jgi:hypothetical protein
MSLGWFFIFERTFGPCFLTFLKSFDKFFKCKFQLGISKTFKHVVFILAIWIQIQEL